MNAFIPVAAIIFYILAARVLIQRQTGALREASFALLNLAGFFYFFFYGQDSRYRPIFAVYLGLVILQFLTLWMFSEKAGWKPWIAFLTPICALIVVRYVPTSVYAHLSGSLRMVLRRNPDFTLGPFFVGLSYLAFRSSYLVLEIRNGVVKRPGFWEYLGFCFFVPTMSVGPINSYSNFRRAFDSVPVQIPAARSMLRVIVGLVKYRFLGPVLNQLTYSGLLMDGHYHPRIDLVVAVLFYYLFLYCNFSGFCDVAIGAAGLIGVPVPENFQNPFGARNVKDFWNRWHITLSLYMRDVVFSPLSKFFARVAGPANTNHAIALTITVVFLLVGIWHGVGWNYAAFGAVHALGVVTNHYYTIGLKKWLGRDRFKAYNSNPWIHSVAVAVTFCYIAMSLFFFANTFPEMKEIFASLK